MQPFIEIQNVSKAFKAQSHRQRSIQDKFINLFQRNAPSEDELFWSLQDVSFNIDQGETVGLIGPNGSGKSTLLKLIAGIIRPTTGDIAVRGRISSLLELGAGFHPDLTGRENIYLNGSIYGLGRQVMDKRVEAIIKFSELEDFIDTPVKNYSSGMYVRLGFAVAIHTKPDIMLIDEVLAVGDASFQHKCIDAIYQFRQQGGTLLLVTHDLAVIQSLCSRAVWFDHGEIQQIGHPTDVVMGYMNQVANKEAANKEAAAKDEDIFNEEEPEEDETTDESSTPETKGRWGTGKIQITEVELCDEMGAPQMFFTTGSTLDIHLHYTTDGLVEAPIFGIGIHGQDSTHICGPNTKFSDIHIPSLQGPGVIRYQVSPLPLLEGTYYLSLAVINETDTETYDYHDRLYTFQVYPGPTLERYGIVTLNGLWHIDSRIEDKNGKNSSAL